jgi:DNA-binding NarL/FixJ family response regulator
VAELVAKGLTNQAIARRLPVAPRTGEAHVDNIRRKLQVHYRWA